MDKYYTPELEEIFNSPELIYSENIHINPYVYRDETKIINLKEDFDINIVKVKYLDKEDIESLGWNRDKVRSEDLTTQLFWKDNFTLIFNKDNSEITIFVRDPSLNQQYLKEITTHLVSKIIIKNKSELIKLLKQLQIG